MCNIETYSRYKTVEEAPHFTLARLMEREMSSDNGSVPSATLRLFIKAHWSKIAKLAHEIHDQ